MYSKKKIELHPTITVQFCDLNSIVLSGCDWNEKKNQDFPTLCLVGPDIINIQSGIRAVWVGKSSKINKRTRTFISDYRVCHSDW